MTARTSIYGPYEGTRRPPSDTALSAWLKGRDMSRFALARVIGCDPKMVGLWADGRVLPSLIYAFKIEQATEGGVPVASWLGTELGMLAWRNVGTDWDALHQQRREEQRRNGPARRARAAEAAEEAPSDG